MGFNFTSAATGGMHAADTGVRSRRMRLHRPAVPSCGSCNNLKLQSPDDSLTRSNICLKLLPQYGSSSRRMNAIGFFFHHRGSFLHKLDLCRSQVISGRSFSEWAMLRKKLTELIFVLWQMRCKNAVESTIRLDLSGQGRSGVDRTPRSDARPLDERV